MDEVTERKTNKGDRCEACFHGEIWMRCRLCGKAYDAYSEIVEDGKTYCPHCNGYGNEVIE